MKKFFAVLVVVVIFFAVGRGDDSPKEAPRTVAKSNIVADTQKPKADEVPPVVLPKEEPVKVEKEPQVKKSGPEYGIGYVGNRNTRKFHRVGCESIARMKASNRVSLNGRDEAVRKGYSPCSRCNP